MPRVGAKNKPRGDVKILLIWNDASDNQEVIDYATWLARTCMVTIQVAQTLVRPWPAASLHKLGGQYSDWHETQTRLLRTKVKKALAAAGVGKDSWAKPLVRFLDGPQEVALATSAAEDFGADLVVLGPDAAAPKGRYRADTVADGLLHSSPIPLGLAPRGVKLSKRGVTRINCVFEDFEDQQLLLHAARLASGWGVDLRLLFFAPGTLESVPVDGVLCSWREDALSFLDKAVDTVASCDYPLAGTVTSGVVTGTDWAAAMGAVKWKKGDLVLVGSAPQGPIERVFIGSHTGKILRHCPVPVVVRQRRLAAEGA